MKNRHRLLRDWLKKWNLSKLRINTRVLDMEWEPKEGDKDAAWELYVELLTRIATQPLPSEHGTEKAALESVYSLFPITREVMRRRGRECIQFTKIAVVVLNQLVRPFTAKWHKLSETEAFEDPEECKKFRKELKALQKDLVKYTSLLADIADVEDLTKLETHNKP